MAVTLLAAACGGGGVAPAASASASAAASAPAAAAAPGGPFLKDDSPEWKAILDAARKEGAITVYGARSPEIEAGAADFQSKFGVKLNYVVGSSGETSQRMLAEKDSGRFVASVVLTGDSAVWTLGPGKEQLLQNIIGIPSGARLHPSMSAIVKESGTQYWPVYAQVYGIFVNTKLVSDADAPKNWKDLLDPKWKGKIVQHDPTRNGGGQAMWGVLLNATGYGEPFLQSLAKQELFIVTGGGDPGAVVARGERALGVPGNVFETTTNAGAPFKYVQPTDGVLTSQFVVGLAKAAPAPNAGKVFINWILSPEMQKLFLDKAYNMPAITGIPGGQYGLAVDTLKVVGGGRIPPMEADAVSAKAKTILPK
ncbi:MAG TPA: extracellular solute-binding protein [Candidatus Limnocylindria bacterium]|nr:extracellular solute-binding protein [Candidatus Limnocylindria bacterium]